MREEGNDMRTMHVRLTPWADERIRRDYGAVNKKNLRQSLRDLPGTEFHTIANPVLGIPGGKVVTVAEAAAAGFDQIELRWNGDANMAIITPNLMGDQVVVR